MNGKKATELQSDRIEMVLASHKAPARVTGGVITPRHVQFHLAPALGTKVSKVQALADELALALGVNNVRVSRQGGGVRIEIPRDNPVPVKLMALMAGIAKSDASEQKQSSSQSSSIPLATAVLGLCDDGAPLVLRLSSPNVAHVLISGMTGSGKTALCQAMILSLAMTHRRSQLQFVLVDPKRRAFAPFAPLPHLLRPIIGDAAEATSALGELVKLMETRMLAQTQAEAQASGQDASEPRIVVVLDELADLMHARGQALVAPLTQLVQRGCGAGIHVIASISSSEIAQKPSAQAFGTLVRANFPARLVGKVASPEDARVASGLLGTGAEKLAGRGDFLAVAAGQIVRFQAAYASPAEVNQIVARRSNMRPG
jgi:S-DNA-T family DNA segregation ATPase FtsK/SpoIIIE